jgi:hypothetical protein
MTDSRAGARKKDELGTSCPKIMAGYVTRTKELNVFPIGQFWDNLSIRII